MSRIIRCFALSSAALILAGCSNAISGSGQGGAAVSFPSSSSSATPSSPVSGSPAAPSSSAGAPSSSAPAGTPAAYGQVLEKIALQKADLPTGYTISLIDGGDQVTGQVTLDTCGFTFTTESHRVARRQYLVFDDTNQPAGVSNELVAYDTPDNAAKALAEWHTAAATCPKTAVTGSDVDDVPTVYTVLKDVQATSSLPVPANEYTAEAEASKSDGTYYEITVLQQHGRYLDIVYYETDGNAVADDYTTALQVATLTGTRLAAQS